MSDLREFLEAKDDLQEKQKLAERAAGALEAMYQALKKETGVKDLPGAEARLKAIRKEHKEVLQERDRKLKEFLDNYGDRLEGGS